MDIESIDLGQIVAAIITTAGTIYVALRGREGKEQREESRATRERPPWRFGSPRLIVCIGLILLASNLGVFVWRYPTLITGWATNGTTVAPTEVKITYPHDGSSVSITEEIKGTSRNIPEGQEIWVLVFPHVTNRYYPADVSAFVQKNGDWSSVVHIGVEGDTGLRFDIVVVVANEDAQDAFRTYLTQAKVKWSWPGLEHLPDGAVIFDRVTVTRQ